LRERRKRTSPDEFSQSLEKGRPPTAPNMWTPSHLHPARPKPNYPKRGREWVGQMSREDIGGAGREKIGKGLRAKGLLPLRKKKKKGAKGKVSEKRGKKKKTPFSGFFESFRHESSANS